MVSVRVSSIGSDTRPGPSSALASWRTSSIPIGPNTSRLDPGMASSSASRFQIEGVFWASSRW